MKRPTIGYVTPFIWGDISLSYLKGVLENSKKHDVNIICYVGQRFEDQENYNYQANVAYNLMSDSWIDGLIIWASQISELLKPQEQKKLTEYFPSVPITTIAAKVHGCSSVIGDAHSGIELLIKHLQVFHKAKSIGFVRGPLKHSVAIELYDAYLDIMNQAGLEVNQDIISSCYPFSKNSGVEAVDEFINRLGIDRLKEVDAIICASDLIATGVIEQLFLSGIHVPDDIAVVGLNNKIDSRLTSPLMTTVDPEINQIGYKAMEVLMDEIKNGSEPCDYMTKPYLVIRRSCGCNENLTTYNLPFSTEGDFHIVFSEDEKNSIIDIMISSLQDSGIDKFENLEAFAKRWSEDLIKSIDNVTNDIFLESLKHYVFKLKKTEVDITIWQTCISTIKSYVIPILKTHRQQMRMQDLCDQIRIEVANSSEYQYAIQKSRMDSRLYLINDTTMTLRGSYVVDELLEYIENTMVSFEVPSCYIVLFDDTKECSKASLLFAYKDEKRINDISSYRSFDAKLLIPEELKEKDKAYWSIVHALYFRESVIGYIVFENGPVDKSLYQIIASEVSGAIYRSRLFNTLKESEASNERLLHELEERNQSLEHKIELRTKDILKVNEQLEGAIKEANNANAAKSQFLANISHEIRTPLNCIIGFADMIRSISKDEAISNYISLTIEETEKLMLLINQLLDLTKIEAGKLELSNEPLSINNLMESLASTYSVVTRNKGLSFEYHINSEVPVLVEGDGLRIRQVLVNLIGNAIKFTEIGGIEVFVDINPKTNNLEFSIKDSGIGIEENRLEAIFGEFEQENSRTSKRYGGTGLGTAISKQLVELMGGSIYVESVKGRGSNFCFSIPFSELDSSEIETYKSFISHEEDGDFVKNHNFENVKILIVEDYPPNRMLALAYLGSLNCKLSIATNGKEAVDMVGENSYDLILMDVQMPILDGVEATKIIRSKNEYDDIKIVGMTANAFESDIKGYYDIGMDDVITKPFRKASLLKKVVKWLTNNDDRDVYPMHLIEHVNKDDEKLPIRYESLLLELDNNEILVKELLSEFVKGTTQKLVELKEAINENDIKRVTTIAHTIKGSALNIAADPLGETAKILELDAKKDYTNNMHQLLMDLNKQLFELEDYLRKEN